MATEGLLSFWWVCPQVASGWRGDRDQQVCAVVEWSGGRGEWFDSTNRRPIDGETACRHFVIDRPPLRAFRFATWTCPPAARTGFTALHNTPIVASLYYRV